jgi:hypothetical protein
MSFPVALYCFFVLYFDSLLGITGKDLEGSSRGLIKVLSRHFAGGTEENTENLIQDSRCPGSESRPNTSVDHYRLTTLINIFHLISIQSKCY